jgi:hypothetical protein
MIANQTVPVAQEFDKAGDLLVQIVKKAKAGENVGQIAQEELPQLVSVLAGVGDFGTEAKDRQVVCETLGRKFGTLVDAFLPAPAAPAAPTTPAA